VGSSTVRDVSVKVIGEARPHDIKIIVSLEASNRVSTCKEINAFLIKEIEQPLGTQADSVRKLQFVPVPITRPTSLGAIDKLAVLPVIAEMEPASRVSSSVPMVADSPGHQFLRLRHRFG
jgi:hypothetical protein